MRRWGFRRCSSGQRFNFFSNGGEYLDYFFRHRHRLHSARTDRICREMYIAGPIRCCFRFSRICLRRLLLLATNQCKCLLRFSADEFCNLLWCCPTDPEPPICSLQFLSDRGSENRNPAGVGYENSVNDNPSVWPLFQPFFLPSPFTIKRSLRWCVCQRRG